jgi:diaminohydroxyphosphoribosylaminopyrimidine deaminase/5-amino-6-(5-phosphoribosylamino)uracil reductase
VVAAASDPDERVSGKGYAILRRAGLEVKTGVLADEASDAMAGYLSRSLKKRPEVILKMALSSDGRIGRLGDGQIVITGDISRRQVHLMRAEADAVLIGIGTALEDDPELTVRLPGLAQRSPPRIVLDPGARLPLSSKLVRSAGSVPLFIAASADADPRRRAALETAGARFLAAETFGGRIALPELLEDLAAQGMASVVVEGGAATAGYFLEEGLVDRIRLYYGPSPIGEGGIAAPIDRASIPEGFGLRREARYGEDHYSEWTRDGGCLPAS